MSTSIILKYSVEHNETCRKCYLQCNALKCCALCLTEPLCGRWLSGRQCPSINVKATPADNELPVAHQTLLFLVGVRVCKLDLPIIMPKAPVCAQYEQACKPQSYASSKKLGPTDRPSDWRSEVKSYKLMELGGSYDWEREQTVCVGLWWKWRTFGRIVQLWPGWADQNLTQTIVVFVSWPLCIVALLLTPELFPTLFQLQPCSTWTPLQVQ